MKSWVVVLVLMAVSCGDDDRGGRDSSVGPDASDGFVCIAKPCDEFDPATGCGSSLCDTNTQCNGVATACATLAQPECFRQEGCSFSVDGGCEGAAESCSSYDRDEVGCDSQGGCDFNAVCAGEPREMDRETCAELTREFCESYSQCRPQ